MRGSRHPTNIVIGVERDSLLPDFFWKTLKTIVAYEDGRGSTLSSIRLHRLLDREHRGCAEQIEARGKVRSRRLHQGGCNTNMTASSDSLYTGSWMVICGRLLSTSGFGFGLTAE